MATHPAYAEATAQAMEQFAGEVVRSSPLQDSGASARAACPSHALRPAGYPRVQTACCLLHVCIADAPAGISHEDSLM